jgi:Leucine-rich repeat (LRR) protein
MDRSFPLQQEICPACRTWRNLVLAAAGLAIHLLYRGKRNQAPAQTPTRTSELILPLLIDLFPSIRTLDLSYNALSSSSIGLSSLILSTAVASSPPQQQRNGLMYLRLLGSKLTELDGLQVIAERFKGNRELPAWELEELDLRDNEISKLPSELGLLPLDVFLVDGNM